MLIIRTTLDAVIVLCHVFMASVFCDFVLFKHEVKGHNSVPF
nr:hypothetical protein [uncultured Aggregatibacter sp.]